MSKDTVIQVSDLWNFEPISNCFVVIFNSYLLGDLNCHIFSVFNLSSSKSLIFTFGPKSVIKIFLLNKRLDSGNLSIIFSCKLGILSPI